ncbi:MAG: methyl-accepting chemotaxis protein [Rhizobacter sp.]|nr:methyl-accepting chemotaxis protein [Rhizobacter sp.]
MFRKSGSKSLTEVASRGPRSIAVRLSLLGCAGLVVVLASVAALLTVQTTRQSRERRVEWVADRAHGVTTAIEGIDLTSRAMVERVTPVFAAMVGPLALSSDGALIADGAPLAENFVAVDRFKAQTGGVATVFAVQDGGFKRVSTSVWTLEKTRALGTMLSPQSPAFQALSAGRPYTGRATLFGKPYMTRYELARDGAGHVVGALFTGFEVSTFDAAIEQAALDGKFFDTGGVFVVDPQGKPQDALFAAHPTMKGRRVLDAYPDAGPFLDRLAQSKGRPVASPGLLGVAGSDRWAVMSASPATGLWVVAEVSDAEAMREHWSALGPFWALLAGGCLLLGAGLMWLLGRQVGAPLRELSQAARAVADGALSKPFTSDRNDEIGEVIRDVDAMRLRFLSLLSTLRESAESIATASRQIAAGNADLSGRTEQSAASLEQTASSMEQLSSAVKQTSHSAEAARALTSSTLAAAAKGAGVAHAAVLTMGEINSAARKISEITGVVDGIAFQTNILALNAAVEAARAGEHGRGFAVVASEVRALAQRSSTASKEIRALIAESVAKAESGAALVASAGAAMDGIQLEARRVDEVVGAISGAASEQADGIAQVTSAVGQLDQNTQQNAALVEQSAAAAESLEKQAQRLTELLQGFKL